jgi:hypothetical protein
MTRRTRVRLLTLLTAIWLGWAGWAFTTRGTPIVISVIDDLGVPISGAEIRAGERLLATTTDGEALVSWRGSLSSIQVAAPGYSAVNLALSEGQPVEAVLKARLLRGRIVDQEGHPIAGAYVTSGAETAVTDAEGRFLVRKAEPGEVEVWRPAWEGATFEWDGGPGEVQAAIAPTVLRAVHIGGEAAEKSWEAFVEMAHATELNALMLDLKDESGVVFYDSQVDLARQVGAVWPRYDLRALAVDAEEESLYLIGRIVVFNDPIASIRSPELAVWDTLARGPYHSGAQYFLDPTDPAAQAYGLDLAREACLAGVDEIQFDYVRFPDDRPDWARFDGGVSPEVRIAAVRDFFATAVAELHPLGCAVAGDVFGFTTRAIDDGGIGQKWEEVTSVLDVVSPMLYPSHYNSGWYNFERPVDFPGEMVDLALADGMERLGRRLVVRPWLQDFGYTADQVRQEIESAESYGLGWMLWNAKSIVSVEALGPPE